MIKLLHFADAHIDMARQGRRDPESGLPIRVLDFLHALDTIVESAITEKVDLVIFAGDAYRDRTPSPTYQREWGRRMMRLSEAGIQTILLVGNHDVTPAAGRAHTLQEFETLQVPNIHVISRPCLLGPAELNGLPVQVVGIPWMNRSGYLAAVDGNSEGLEEINKQIEEYLVDLVDEYLDDLDSSLPAVLTSHISVQGAMYGNERSVMLGRDMVLSPGIVKDERLDYVALGHIHKAQDLAKPEDHHPIVYPGSIERVDFGEIKDEKRFIVATLEKGQKTRYTSHTLNGRVFLSTSVVLTDAEAVQKQIMDALLPAEKINDAIYRLILTYPREWEPMIDEDAVRYACEGAFEFHLQKRPLSESRLRLSEGEIVANMAPDVLINKYWDTVGTDKDEAQVLNAMAGDIIRTVEVGVDPDEQLNGGLA